MGLVKVSSLIGDESTIYTRLIDEASFRIRCAVPGIIQSFDSKKNTVEVQPAVRERIIQEDGSLRYMNLPLLINVPVLFPQSSVASIRFPLVQGDECLVIFSDLSIDNFWEKGNVQNPVEVRRHDLSDGLAIPCKISQPNIESVEDELFVKYKETTAELTETDIYVTIPKKGRISLSESIDRYNRHTHIDSMGKKTSSPDVQIGGN